MYVNTIVRKNSKTVCRPAGSSRLDPRYTSKVVKYSFSVLVWDVFFVVNMAPGTYFIPQNTTIREENYLDAQKDSMHRFFELHQPRGTFLHYSEPPHRCKMVWDALAEADLPVIICPGY